MSVLVIESSDGNSLLSINSASVKSQDSDGNNICAVVILTGWMLHNVQYYKHTQYTSRRRWHRTREEKKL